MSWFCDLVAFAYSYLHHALDKNSHVEALYDYSHGEIKNRKKSLGKENEKTGQKKNERDKKKNVLQCDVFPGNRDLLSKTLRGPVFPLVCGFIGRYNP